MSRTLCQHVKTVEDHVEHIPHRISCIQDKLRSRHVFQRYRLYRYAKQTVLCNLCMNRNDLIPTQHLQRIAGLLEFRMSIHILRIIHECKRTPVFDTVNHITRQNPGLCGRIAFHRVRNNRNARSAKTQNQHRTSDEAQHEIHERPCNINQKPLPPRLAGQLLIIPPIRLEIRRSADMKPLLFRLRRFFFSCFLRRISLTAGLTALLAIHGTISAKRHRTDRIHRILDPLTPQSRTHTDREFDDTNAELLGHPHMTGFVNQNCQQEYHKRPKDANQICHSTSPPFLKKFTKTLYQTIFTKVKTKPEEPSQVFPRFTADQSFPANTIQHALRPGLVLSYSHARLV